MKIKVILALLLAAVASAVWILLQGQGTDSPVARITRNGTQLEEIDLSQVDEPCSFVLEDENGFNTVLVEKGRIRISAADCPDQICVKQGWISDGAVPIVCLPHKLVVEIVDAGGELDGGAG